MRLAAHKQALSEEDTTTISDMLGNAKKLQNQGVNVDSFPIKVQIMRMFECEFLGTYHSHVVYMT